MTGLEACFDNWGPKAVVFLEARRLNPFDPRLGQAEDVIFHAIDQEKERLIAYASGERVRELRENGNVLRKIGFAEVPITPTMEQILHEVYDDDKKIRALTDIWVDGPNAVYDGFMAWFDLHRVLSGELLRHRTLLDEQRELLNFMRTAPGLTSLDYHQKWFAEGRKGDATGQYVKFQWAAAWQVVQSQTPRASRLSHAAWQRAYETVLGTTHTPQLYKEMLPYLWELAFLSFEAAPDVPRRLLGSVLYTTILDEEKADCLKAPVACAIEEDLQHENPFRSPDFVRFDPSREAGYFRQDRGKWFVFKVTDEAEVTAHAAVTEALRDPVATYTRLVERYRTLHHTTEELFAPQNKNLFYREVCAAKDALFADPLLSRFFSRPAVAQAGLVVSPAEDVFIVTMHNAGKTLASEVDATQTKEERTALYERGLETLARFHVMGTLNLLRVEGINTPIPHIICRDGIPIPTISYPHLIAYRMGGTIDAPRLGRHPKTDPILMEIHRIGQFLDRGCLGTIVQEPFEENIAQEGLIDLEKLSLGNFLYDTARFLYGSSFERRRDVDIFGLREHYIRSLITPVAETHNAKNPTFGLDYAEIIKSYEHFRANTEFMRVLISALQENARKNIPQEVSAELSDDVFAGFIGRSVIDATLSWDCCRPGAAERMREYCQAAAILVCMGETGALVHQREIAVQREPSRVAYFDKEIEHAIRNSLTLMYGQGFVKLAKDWETYLHASGKIPSSFIVYEARGFERALIPDLSERIDRELQHYSLGFRGDPHGPLSQIPSYGKRVG